MYVLYLAANRSLCGTHSENLKSCLKSNVQDIMWEFRVRLCNACKKTWFVISLYFFARCPADRIVHSTKGYSRLVDSSFYLSGERKRLLPNIALSDVVAKTGEYCSYIRSILS